MPAKNPREVFVMMLSALRRGTERANDILRELSEAAQDPEIKEALEARVWVSDKILATQDKVFELIGEKPAKLTEGVGGALMLTFAYIFCLDVCLRAVGTHANFFAIAVVYLTGSAIGSIVPTPGGLGAIEVALSGGLTTIAHVPGAYALSAVLLYRLITFWLPIPIGWLSLNYLQHRDAL